MYNAYFFIIIIVFCLNFIWQRTLSYLSKKNMGLGIPAGLEDVYDSAEYAKQQEYQKQNLRLGALSESLSFIISLVILAFGLLGWLDDVLRAHTENFLLLPLLFFGVLTLGSDIIQMPFGWYDTFVIEERFGFNKSTRKLFIMDYFKSLLLKIIIGGLVLGILLVIYKYTGSYFWLLAWTAAAVISLVMSLFYSEWIVPLFNKQTPLEDGELRGQIEQFASRAEFNLTDIYVMDASKRSTKANAYFTGFGKKKRIILFDTLIKQLSPQEIVAVLAHEIGHYKKKHVIQTLCLSLITMGITFWLMSLFLDSLPLAEALGGNIPSFHLGIIGFSFVFTPVSELLGLCMNWLSRKNEYEADAFTAKFGLGGYQISALKKISSQALVNLNPHPWVVFWEYSHPTLKQRIERIEQAETNDTLKTE